MGTTNATAKQLKLRLNSIPMDTNEERARSKRNEKKRIQNIIDIKFMTVHLIQRYFKRTCTNLKSKQNKTHMIEIDSKILFSI